MIDQEDWVLIEKQPFTEPIWVLIEKQPFTEPIWGKVVNK